MKPAQFNEAVYAARIARSTLPAQHSLATVLDQVIANPYATVETRATCRAILAMLNWDRQG